MSQEGAAYRFLPWVRRGAAAHITTADDATAPGIRATLPVAVTFNADPALATTTEIELSGPGDIIQFDARAIARTWPPAQSLDAEPNFFLAVELDQIDLPWRYTPRAEDENGRLRPWLCLLAFTEGELGPFVPARADRPLESVTIQPGAPMPPPSQTWAWAHAQVSGDDDLSLEQVATRQPQRCLSRLLCPRRLTARTSYWALLVPTFEVGRRAGLRLPLGAPAAGLDPAWTTTTLAAPLELPIYHRWKFTCGPGGDFESLARRLSPRTLPPEVGTRPLDVARPGGGLPAAASFPLRLGGALQRPSPASTPEPESSFQTALVDLLDRPADVLANGGTPLVAPPLYGAWHARRARLDAPAAGWFQALNVDPRARVAAGLGTEIVQDLQQELMASAWEQVEGIRDANTRLRMAQLARAVGERLHRRFVRPAAVDEALALTAGVLGQVRMSTRTARARVDDSPSRFAVFSGTMRRFARPLGPLGRRQARPDRAVMPPIGHVNAGTYDAVLAATPPPLAKGVPTRTWLDATTGRSLPGKKEIEDAPPRPKGLAWDPIDGRPARTWPVNSDSHGDSPSMKAFRVAAAALAGRDSSLVSGATVRRLNVVAMKKAVEAAIEPRAAINASFAARAVRSPGLVWNPVDPMEPVMAHPIFPQPMYKPLAELSSDWMLPGLSSVPADTVALAETNPAFIEAYMVGLNHEMSRELLWNEFPSDQRGSYFRQFWDPAGLAPVPVPESAKDIQPVHAWSPNSPLGTHSPRPVPPGGKHLVLVIRGALLHRYPSTLVYAQRATKAPTSYALGADRRDPVFAGRLRPDVALFGFALTREETRGTATTDDPGWFFVFEEQPGEPRFGLDVEPAAGVAGTWADLAWSHLVTAADELEGVHYIDIASPLPVTAHLEDPDGPGWHLSPAEPGKPFARGADHAVITCQQPVRVALHGAQFLP